MKSYLPAPNGLKQNSEISFKMRYLRRSLFLTPKLIVSAHEIGLGKRSYI